ncbi:hypothetical protein GCM10010873_21730 [Cypionkella aquatica]|uniref:3-hydroxyacyl-CoA dehydrogenase NAD binding domain-containing protein n=1 Tax=Cypionkella aquatica TaxID=1756042 RepID=A0AA37X0S2_9RHOB|nr:enoyl-CoA hydratase/isomerase family protein [Cypionkella aquatica]GLS87199.1 hypothetical protein GCM10010873_21730 [Cypionkella aquatica]
MDGKPVTDAVRVARDGAVLLLILAQPPVNSMTHPLRAALSKSLALGLAADVSAVVIASDIAAFSAGATLSEGGQSVQEPSLATLCAQVENFPKPVIVALNGSTMGAGLELALAAHGRIAAPAAQLGLPAVALGLVPEAGSSQRLPRLVGAAAALKLLLEPGALSATQALLIGLVDQVVEGDLRAQAAGMARQMAVGGAWVKAGDRGEGLRDGKAYQAAVAAARLKHQGTPLPAVSRLIDCVAAAQLLPFAQGLAFEAAAYEDLAASAEARGLQHAFQAERRAAFPPAWLAQATVGPLSSLAVWGAAGFGADLVAQALAAGLRVCLFDPSRDALVAALQKIAERQEVAVAAGRLTAEARDADWARLTTGSVAVGPVDLVLNNAQAGGEIGAGFTASDVPQIQMAALPLHDAGGKVALRAAPAAGLIAELGVGPQAPPTLAALGLALGRRLGWVVLVTGPGGPIEQRLRATLSAAIAQLERDGTARGVIAAALGSYGFGAKGAVPNTGPEARAVLDACLAALANEGARLMSQGVARRPSDVDAAAVLNGIFPRWHGGPLFQADQRGLLVLRAYLRKRAEHAPALYAPDLLLDRLIADGQNFAALNRLD